MHASESKLSKELKYGIEILVGQAVLKLWTETVKLMFWPITRTYLNFDAIFESLEQFTIRYNIFLKGFEFWDRAQNMLIFD